MSSAEAESAAGDELDVREIPKPQRHPLIFKRFAELAVGESFVLVNSHDPKHLRQEFDRDLPGAYGWDYEQRDPRLWRIRISRRAEAPSAQLLCDVPELLSAEPRPEANDTLWSLPVSNRQLDSNVIRLAPEAGVAEHVGPDLDVMMYVLAGSGEVTTNDDPLRVGAGSLVWLPRRSRRAICAGADGLSYVTVHQRRPALTIGPVS